MLNNMLLLRALANLRPTTPLTLTSSRQLSFYKLRQRGLIELRGETTAPFLQGLVTNDVHLLNTAKKNAFMYSLFLNAKGRVISDAFIYRIAARNEEPQYLIECDKEVIGKLLKLLGFYNLRKKVSVEEANSLEVWAALPDPGTCLSEATSWTEKPISTNGVLFYAPDPRAVPGWSGRIIHTVGSDVRESFGKSSEDATSEKESAVRYRRVRYRLGLPEGVEELKSDDGLPLEANADLCGGVSFSKGCYIGQELTARSRFTGIIRRRVAPIRINTPVDPTLFSVGSPIYRVSESGERIGGRPIGWLRGLEKSSSSQQPQLGIALLRLSDTAETIRTNHQLYLPISKEPLPEGKSVVVDPMHGVLVNAFIPSWWPSDIISGIPQLPA